MNKEEILPASNPQSPFYQNLPKRDARPVDELVKFFKQYKTLIKNLLNYFKEIALVKEFESNLHHQLVTSFNTKLTPTSPSSESKRPNLLKSKSNSNQNFLKGTSTGSKDVCGSVNTMIVNHHTHNYNANLKAHKELTGKLIPKLETLLKNLSNKIKEIRSSLKNESFANDTILKEISKTGSVLKTYMNAIELYNNQDILLDTEDIEANDDNEGEGKLDDPFLIKLRLNYQLKNQLLKENYLFAAFINLQNISKDLLIYILKDLNQIFERFEKLNHMNYKQHVNFDPNEEWQAFVMNNPNFLNVYGDSTVNPKREVRHFKGIVLPYANSIHNKCIRFGIIYKKSKLLKNYNRFYYLLTCNYLHEFKIESPQQNTPGQTTVTQTNAGGGGAKNKLMGFINHNDVPVKSYNLNNYNLQIKNEKNFKFNLSQISTGKQTSFKCNNLNDFNNWVMDLNDLLQFESNNAKRFEFVERKLSNRQSNQKFFETPNDSKSSLSNFHDISVQSEINKFSHTRSTSSLSQSSLQSQALVPYSNPTSSNSGAFKAPSHINLTPSSFSANSSPSGSVNPTPRDLQGANHASLQGVFTPNIKTPSSSGSDKNPFDQSFGALDHTSPIHSGPGSPGSVSAHHENYLKIQQEYLKQQQEVIHMKLKETQQQQQQQEMQPPPPEMQHELPQRPVSPSYNSNNGPKKHMRHQLGHSKSDSVSSMNSQYKNDSDSNSNSSSNLNLQNLSISNAIAAQKPASPARHKTEDSISSTNSNSFDSIKSLGNSKINNFLQQNENLVVPKFFITDEQDKTEET